MYVHAFKWTKLNMIEVCQQTKVEFQLVRNLLIGCHRYEFLLFIQHSFSLFQEIVVGSNMDKIYIVMDYVEHDMKSLMETMKNPFLMGQWLCSIEGSR